MLFAPGGPQSPRRRSRIKAIGLTIFLVLALYILFFAHSATTPHSVTKSSTKGSYAQQHGSQAKPTDAVRQRRDMVVASMKDDDTSWLFEFFPDWHKSIYVVDDKSAPLTVPRNKGREGMVYLT